MCALAMAGIAEADLRLRIRTCEPKDEECNFAKRTHLSHVKSVVCVFQGRRKQGRSVAKDVAEPDQDTHNTGISVTKRKIVVWPRDLRGTNF